MAKPTVDKIAAFKAEVDALLAKAKRPPIHRRRAGLYMIHGATPAETAAHMIANPVPE